MRVDLSEEEVPVLRKMLHDYLPDLRREVARTDVREFRHELVKRQDLCERLLALLGGPVPAEPSRTTEIPRRIATDDDRATP